MCFCLGSGVIKRSCCNEEPNALNRFRHSKETSSGKISVANFKDIDIHHRNMKNKLIASLSLILLAFEFLDLRLAIYSLSLSYF